MTTLNTIIEKEKSKEDIKFYLNAYAKAYKDGHVGHMETVEEALRHYLLTTAMQRAYEAGREDQRKESATN